MGRHRSAWKLDFARDSDRIARLTRLQEEYPFIRWDGTMEAPGAAPARCMLAGAWFWGDPGREQEAAEAWAFEMKVYFKRGVGEPPVVEYEDGGYTVTGLITTTHPGDQPGEDGILWFS